MDIALERLAILRRLERWLEIPLFVLGLAWLALLIMELTVGITPTLEFAGTLIWGVFIVDFALRLAIAPNRSGYLRKNVLTIVALLIPAMRVFRLARMVRVLRATRALRGVRLVRLITSFNRGMRALGATLGRRGFGYVSLLTALVTVLGAAGMFAFEQEVAGSAMQSYGASLWWTAMLMTTMGTDYWPQTGEGRILCFLLALYAFGVFGYVTATISTFFIGRDAENAEGELAGATEIRGLAQQVNALRAEIAALNARSPERG
jgi:voltage-gated potassium channel